MHGSPSIYCSRLRLAFRSGFILKLPSGTGRDTPHYFKNINYDIAVWNLPSKNNIVYNFVNYNNGIIRRDNLIKRLTVVKGHLGKSDYTSYTQVVVGKVTFAGCCARAHELYISLIYAHLTGINEHPNNKL